MFGEAEKVLAESESGAPNLQDAESKLFELREDENRVRDEAGAARQRVDVLATLRTRRAERPLTHRHDQAGFLGDRNEDRRRYVAADRMGPAHQRFAGRDLAGLQIHQRLQNPIGPPPALAPPVP